MTNQLLDLTGSVALVTGGNSGIGRSIALTYAKAGAAVAIVGRNPEKNAGVLAELQALGAQSIAIKLDISNRAEIEPAVQQVERELGAISILVNNAGTGAAGGVLTLDFADWDRVMETNLTAPFAFSRCLAPSMTALGRGKIINIASASAFYGYVRLTAYAVSKAALLHLTKCIAVELGPFNVQTNAIVPGWTETDMAERMKQSPMYPRTLELTPAGRWAVPQDIANTALFLASHASDYMNGATLVVDGGMTLTYAADGGNAGLGADAPTAE
ncbi:MAG TPA: SDR family oxidoreductase [Dehalococcoidia bacterium]|nr:SDR family oxidoreductase [Dehalococcoidia bacterium]